jgi:hypothetical protein
MEWALRFFGLRGPATDRIPSKTELWVYTALGAGGLSLNIAVHLQPFSAIGAGLFSGGIGVWLVNGGHRARAILTKRANSHGAKEQ